jgi:hypothetical protein
VVIPFTLPRVRIRWRLWAWLAALPGWVVPVSAAAGTLVFLAALALWYRRARRAAMARKVAPDEVAAAAVPASEEWERRQLRRSASGGAAPRNWGVSPTVHPGFGGAAIEPERPRTYSSSHSPRPFVGAPRAWEEEGGLPPGGWRPSQQYWAEDQEAPPPWRRPAAAREGGPPGPFGYGDIPTEGVRARLAQGRLRSSSSSHSPNRSFATPREWEEGGLSPRGWRPSRQYRAEGQEAQPPWRRPADAWGGGYTASPPRREWGEEFAQQAAPAPAGRGLYSPARRGAPPQPLTSPRVALSPQRAAAMDALRAPQRRAPAVPPTPQERAAALAARSRAAKAAAAVANAVAAEAAADAALAAAEAEEAAEVGEFLSEDAAEGEGGAAEDEEGEVEGVDEEEAEEASDREAPEEEVAEEEAAEEEEREEEGADQSPASSRFRPRARPRLSQLAPLRPAGDAAYEASMSTILLKARRNAQRAREGRLQAEQRQQQRGAGATAVRSGATLQTLTREGGGNS